MEITPVTDDTQLRPLLMYYNDIQFSDDGDKIDIDQFKEELGEQQEFTICNPLILSLLVISILSNSAYAIIAPFLPNEFKAKGVDQQWVGFIFSAYSVAVIICSPIIGNMLNYYSRRKIVAVGMMLMGQSFIGFGLISYIKYKPIFIALSIVVRFMQGMAASLIQTTVYSIGTNFFPNNKVAMIGYIESAIGTGCVLGPIIGSGLYAIGGYRFIFWSFGVFFMVASLCVKCVMSEKIDMKRDEGVRNDPNGLIEQDKQITQCDLLSKPRFVFASLSAALAYFLYGFMEPVLATRLLDYNLSQVQISLFFVILPFFYLIQCTLVQRIPTGIERRVTLISSAIALVVGSLFLGPSRVLHFPDTVWMAAIGQMIHGIFQAMLMVTSMPEMITSSMEHYPTQEERINDLSSGLFSMFLGIGLVAGPLYGAFMTQYFGYQYCTDVVALLILVFVVPYFFLAGGKEAFQKSKWKNIDEQENSKFNYQSIERENQKGLSRYSQ